MKTKLFLIASLLITISASSQLLQKNFGTPQKHFNNLNIAPVDDGSNDIIIASNLFHPSAPISEPTLKRVDENGVLIWTKTYENTTLQNARLFDIVNYFDLVFVTGSIDIAGTKRTFIAKIEAFSGNVLDSKFYDMVSPNFNSRGLKIIFSESDANNDGLSNPGLVVTGFFGTCYSINVSCPLNAGFIFRTDINLNTLWSKELESIVPGSAQDFDFINGIVETNDGLLLTGSVTGENSIGLSQQGVLAHKIDFEGNFQWDASYIRGNSSDISVDAYYDLSTNEIFMLTNYSVLHNFGITVLNNANGAIITAKSWEANEVNFELDFYGFSLLRSVSNPNNLVIMGYRRDFFNGTGFDQSNPFIYEFDKSTGIQSGDSYQYLLPFVEPIGDEYNFWNGQMPLMFYPDMAMLNVLNSGVTNYMALGYRLDATNYGNIELFKIDNLNRNVCDNLPLQFNSSTLGSILPITTVSSGTMPIMDNLLTLNFQSPTITQASCDPSLSVGSNQILDIKLYPNPASDYIYLTGDQIVFVQVVDSTGRIVLQSKPLDSSNRLFVGDIKTGIYFVSVTGINNQTQTFKLLKK
ncbi:MAG: T9SS type A sorting domain-containing protein [Flavobacteriaceae bacterium]|nr:T9SS type A sorting domain-containing protein [Flavobacteriaceae bacterium]